MSKRSRKKTFFRTYSLLLSVGPCTKTPANMGYLLLESDLKKWVVGKSYRVVTQPRKPEKLRESHLINIRRQSFLKQKIMKFLRELID